MANRHRRSIRNLLLDRRFQLRFTLLLVLISAMLTAGLGTIWYREARTASKLIEVTKLGVSEAEAEQFHKEVASNDAKRLLVLVGFGVLLAFVLAGYSIVFTHKIAGPLFKIGRHLQSIRDNQLQEVWDLRKGDQLQEFWKEFRGMHTALRARQKQEAAMIEQAIDALESDDTATRTKALAQLRELVDEKRTSVGELNAS